MKKFRITELLISVVGAELVGALSALVSGGKFAAIYSSLTRPPFSPPAWVFPAVWVILYAAMGDSAYLIFLSDDSSKSKALTVYAAQLLLNSLWSPIFFAVKSFLAASVIVILLTFAVALMFKLFYRIRRKAAFLNLPYLMWCVYASYLTFGVYILNR